MEASQASRSLSLHVMKNDQGQDTAETDEWEERVLIGKQQVCSSGA